MKHVNMGSQPCRPAASYAWSERLRRRSRVRSEVALAAAAAAAAIVGASWGAGGVCPADITGDGKVDGSDLGQLLGGWNQPGPTDLDGNGITDGADLGVLLNSWGDCGGGPGCELSWDPQIGNPGFNGAVRAAVEWADAGSVFVAGSFTTANGQAAQRIAREFDGFFVPVAGGGLSNADGTAAVVNALAIFDDGSGPALYAAGRFNRAGTTVVGNVAKWNGISWMAVPGLDGTVHALEVFDAGSGPALYAGGEFTSKGGASFVARLGGSRWVSVGAGVNGPVFALASFQLGDEPWLLVGGEFTVAGGSPSFRLGVWTGAEWYQAEDGFDGAVRSLHATVEAGRPVVYAGGDFLVADSPSNRIARYDFALDLWSPMGDGLPSSVRTIATFDPGDGAGPRIVAGGDFGIRDWDGLAWRDLGSGVDGAVFTLLPIDNEPESDALGVGGDFTVAGGNASAGVAVWQCR